MPDAVLLVELGAIILGLGLLAAVAARLSISPIPLYLVAGLAFGTGGLLPLGNSSTFISTGAEVGVILLLLSLGLEYTATDLLASMRSSTASGLLDLVANATPGLLAALLLGWGPVAALALAGITYISSSGITAKLLRDLRWLGRPETGTVVSLLVFEDLVMAGYLALLTALLAGAGVTGTLAALAIAAGVTTAILLLALRYGRLMERLVAGPTDEIVLLKVLGLTVLVAGLAQQLRVSAAVGAFLVGIALSGPLAHTARELLAPLRDLFAAVFFVFFGLATDPADLPAVALPAAALAATGIATKLATGWITAGRITAGRTTAGRDDRDKAARLRAGTALVARGEFSVVIAGLAVAAGVQPRLGPLTAAYVLTLAIAGPLLVRVAEPLARALSHRPGGRSDAAPS